MALPGTAQAQCGGSMGVTKVPDTTTTPLLFTGAPLGETVRITLTPAATGPDLRVSSVQYALACINNNDIVPCSNGNESGATEPAPVVFAGNVGGTCGAVAGVEAAGVVTFNFDPLDLDSTGCTVAFDVTVDDIGTDATPLGVTGAAQASGTCPDLGGIAGTARGSTLILLETVPDIEIVKEISIDGGSTWDDANTEGTALVATIPPPVEAEYRFIVRNTGTAPLINVTVEDADLGIPPTSITDLAPDDGAPGGPDEAIIGSGDIAELVDEERCDSEGLFMNTARAEGESADDGTIVDDTDPAYLRCDGDPDIEILKEVSLDNETTWFDANDPPFPEAGLGDNAWYRLTVKNTGSTALTNVLVNDTELGIVDFPVGDLAANDNAPGGPDEVVLDQVDIQALFQEGRCENRGEAANVASVSGDTIPPVAAETVSDSDPATILCIGEPDIDIVKEISVDGGTTWEDANDEDSAPEVDVPSDALFRITVKNIGTAPLINATVEDPDLGIPPTSIPDLAPDDGAPGGPDEVVILASTPGFEALDVEDYCDNAGTFINMATAKGESEDEPGTIVQATDPAYLKCVTNPEIDIEKEISIDGGTTWEDADDVGSAPVVEAPSGALYRLIVRNVGTADLENILVSDPTLGLVDVPVQDLAANDGAPGGPDEVIIGSGTEGFEALDVAERCTGAEEAVNTASVSGDSVDDGQTVNDADPAYLVCEVTVAEICRTIGFWGTHGGSENDGPNVTQMVLDAAGGPLNVCGATIDNTAVGDTSSALEAICASPSGGDQRVQLTRQLTGMALNCVLSGGGTDCSGTSVATLFGAANEACANDVGNLGDYIGPVDCFNNGGEYIDGECVIDEEDNCHDRPITDSDLFEEGFNTGPASSAEACRDARKNDVLVLSPPPPDAEVSQILTGADLPDGC
jgi:hypothetical protein